MPCLRIPKASSDAPLAGFAQPIQEANRLADPSHGARRWPKVKSHVRDGYEADRGSHHKETIVLRARFSRMYHIDRLR